MKKFILAFLLVVLFSTTVFSWNCYTHQYLANRVYIEGVLSTDLEAGCPTEIKIGACDPDIGDHRDPVNHHCYDLSQECIASEYYECPVENHCPALEKMNEELDIFYEMLGNGSEKCDAYFHLGRAAHYFFDSKVIWHQVQKEDYDKCHKPFEDDVGAAIGGNFEITVCDQTVVDEEFEPWIAEFESILGFNNTVKPSTKPPITTTTKDKGIWPFSGLSVDKIKDMFTGNNMYILLLGVFLVAISTFVRLQGRRRRRYRRGYY